MNRRKPRRRKYTQCVLDSAAVAATLRRVMAIGGMDAPLEVVGWFLAGTVRRVRADYPNGWRLQFSITDKGNVTRVCASLHITSKGHPHE